MLDKDNKNTEIYNIFVFNLAQCNKCYIFALPNENKTPRKKRLARHTTMCNNMIANVTRIGTYERCATSMYVVFDKEHETAKCGETLASIVEVCDDLSYESYKALNKKYDINRYWIVSAGVCGEELQLYVS